MQEASRQGSASRARSGTRRCHPTGPDEGGPDGDGRSTSGSWETLSHPISPGSRSWCSRPWWSSCTPSCEWRESSTSADTAEDGPRLPSFPPEPRPRPHLHRRRPMSIRVRRARSGASPARAPRLRSRSRGRCPSRVTSTARCPPHLRRAARQIPAKSPFLPLSSSALRPPVRPCQTTGRNARRLLLEQTSAERTSCWFIYRQEPSPSPPLGRRFLRRVFHSNPGEGSSPRTRWCREQRG
jgi:hypothetical protein